jgi:hypothetical protein
MKKIASLIILALMAFTITSQAQGGDKQERIEKLKVAFITEKLALSTEEGDKFWPIYNEFSKERKATKKSIRDLRKKLEFSYTATDIVNYTDQIATLEKKEIDLKAKFVKDTLPVLGPAKTVKLASLEEEFKKELLQKIKERRQGGEQMRKN